MEFITKEIEMETKDIITSIESSKSSYFDSNDLPRKPGVYGIFLNTEKDLPEEIKDLGLSIGDCAYIGKSESSLHSREIGTHFIEEESGLGDEIRSIIENEKSLADKLPASSNKKARVAAIAASMVVSQMYSHQQKR